MTRPARQEEPTRKPLWHPRWGDFGGLLGAFMVVPQVIDRYTTGQSADPVLAGLGTLLVLVASGGPRAAEIVVRRWERAK